jgi:TatD DNase family protein
VIDTHCHLDVPAFDGDRDEVLARAGRVGVVGVLVPAIRPATWPGLVALARTHPSVRIAFGVHPQAVPALAPDEENDLTGQIARATADAGPLAVAVGECGLDGATGEQDRQEALFRAHIRAARELKKPLLVHVLRAHDVAPRILREERAHEVGGVMHSYSGSPELVGVYRDLLLAETDAPDQTPAAHRGKRCEPAFVLDVIDGLAAARGALPPRIAELTTANARRLFGDFAIDSGGR